jgi:hypothetical protein
LFAEQISGSFLPLGAAWAMTLRHYGRARGELVIDGDGLDRDGPPAPRVWLGSATISGPDKTTDNPSISEEQTVIIS